MLHGLLQLALKATGAAPYKILPGPNNTTVVWEKSPDNGWQPIATFARRADAEAFVFIKTPPVWGR